MTLNSLLSARIAIATGLALFAWQAAELRGDEAAAGAQQTPGIRQIASAHLTLYTDLPASDEIDALPGYFDQAFAQWCAYFGVDAQKHKDWRARCYLIGARERFESAGLWPQDLPSFNSGYTRGDQMWIHEQATPYYRRHLLLHEGTHAFMYALVGSACPPWYFEGVAELLATHRLQDDQLTLGYFPQRRDEVPKLGRIEMVQAAFAAKRPMSLGAVFAYDESAHFHNEPYAWCWAAAAFLDGHPRYQARFRELARMADRDDFAERAKKLFAADARLAEDWQLFVANLDYGYDFRRMDVEFSAGRPLDDQRVRASVAADHGWQASGVRLEAGQTYRIRASGRYQLAQEPRPWECEPGGVTMRYYRGQPLGILLAAVREDDSPASGPSGLLEPIVVGLDATHTASRSGTLYLRINDSPRSLGDNSGAARVEISRPK